MFSGFSFANVNPHKSLIARVALSNNCLVTKSKCFFFHFCISDLINIQLEHLEVTKIFFQKVYPRNLFNFESGTSHPTLISYFITPANIYRIFTFSSFLQNRRNVRQFNILVHQICCSPHIPITSLSSITARISCSNQMKQSEHIK